MKYRVTIETLAPLHIGTGTELLAKFDYVSKLDSNVTFVLDQDAIYADELKRNGDNAKLDRAAGDLLSDVNWYDGSPFVRYAMRGSTRLERAREQIKDVNGRCYLPGSSIKGALRTALLAYAHMSAATGRAGVNYVPKQGGKGYVKEAAASKLEATAFRSADRDNANHDLLRALQVSDSAPLPRSPSPLELQEARVFTGANDKPGAPIALETIRSKTVFATTITIDELTLQYSDKLRWADKAPSLIRLIEVLQHVSQRRIVDELETARTKEFARTVEFYERLAATAEACRGRSAAVLQMSWGTGWTGITVGPWLSDSEQDMAREKFELGRPQGLKGRWQPDLSQPFPKSRRLGRIASQVSDDQPGRPFGWVLMAFASEETGLEQKKKIWAKLSTAANATFKLLPQAAPLPALPTHASASQPKPNLRVAPESKPTRPVTGARRLVPSFTEPPKPGDRFKGEIFDVTGRRLSLTIPGLEDTVAYAVIEPEENRGSKKFTEGNKIVCEVLGLEQEKNGCWRVKCQKG